MKMTSTHRPEIIIASVYIIDDVCKVTVVLGIKSWWGREF